MAPKFNTHTSSPAWVPICALFRTHASSFVESHASERYQEKFLIGAAMWEWMCARGVVPGELMQEAQRIHFRRGKERDGLPLWRIAFRASIRNTPEIDSLFAGNRKGPTPLYARLVSQGLVPDNPHVQKPRDESEEDPALAGVVGRYSASSEWVVHSDGLEWLYVYSTTREMENFERHGIEPLLKIGSSRAHYSARIAQQAGSTAAGTRLVCLHAYRVRSARQAESAMHHALKLQGRHVTDSPGIEWFEVAPRAVHELAQAICGCSLPPSAGKLE